MRFFFIMLLVIGGVLGASCEYSYDAPETWGMVCNAPMCNQTGSTAQQSPIDLVSVATTATGDRIFPRYESVEVLTKMELSNKGHTVQVTLPSNTTARVEGIGLGATRQLLQFHVHTPSEHTVDGVHYPLEIHFVHADEGGNLAVIGVFFQTSEAGDSSALLNAIVDQIDAIPNSGDVAFVPDLDLDEIFSSSLSYWAYPGSLTTPPCSEGVSWMVLQRPRTASSDQIDSIRDLIHKSNRPVQALNSRTVLSYIDSVDMGHGSAASSPGTTPPPPDSSNDDDTRDARSFAIAGVVLSIVVILFLIVVLCMMAWRIYLLSELIEQGGYDPEASANKRDKKAKEKARSKKHTRSSSDSNDTDTAMYDRTAATSLSS